MLKIIIRKDDALQQLFDYIYTMRQQNEKVGCTFTIEKASLKGPFYLNQNNRVASLQNKVTFYEGQLDPLHLENQSAKQNFMNLSKIVSISTQILRNLLPVGNNPAKKLKLEMSTIDEIAKMIEADWKDMEQQIATLLSQRIQLKQQIQFWKSQLQNEQSLRAREVKQLQDSKLQLKSHYEQQIQLLNLSTAKMKQQLKAYKEQSSKEQALRDSLINSSNRELQLLRQEARCKYNDYERCIARLTAQADSNLLEFDEGKKMVKLICEKMMNEKLAEQAEAYELMLKIREDEKNVLKLSIIQITDDYKKKLNSKDEEIQSLVLQNENRKTHIKKLEDDIYLIKEELMKEMKESKDLQSQLLKISQKNETLLDKINKYERNIKQKEEKLKLTIDAYENDLKMIKDKGNMAINQILEENKRLEKVILDKSGQLTKIKKIMETVEDQWKQKIKTAQKKWMEKQSEFASEISKNLKKIAEESERIKRIKEEKQKQLLSLSKEHEQMIKRLQKQFQENKQELLSEHQAKIKKLIQENKEQIIKLKVDHQKEIELEQKKIEGELKKIKFEYSQKLEQRQKLFQQERNSYEEQIELGRNKQYALSLKLAQAHELIAQSVQQLESLKIEQMKALSNLQKENELNSKRWQEMMEKQMQGFLKELQIKQCKIFSLQEQFSQQRQEYEKKLISKDAELVSIKESWQKEINSLKDSNGTQDIENKYKAQMNILRDSLYAKLSEAQKHYLSQINNLKACNQKQIKSLKTSYDLVVLESHQSFQKSLIELATFYQKKNIFVNETNLSNQIDKVLVHLPQEQKFEFIRSKMQESVQIISEKDNQITQLEQNLERYEKHMEEQLFQRKRQMEQQKTKMMHECNSKIGSKEEECRLKVQKTEKDRIAFSEELFKEFNEMKENYKNQYGNLEKKYKQLEALFSDRPSRVQDVTKIKELINIQTKLDQQITIYHKKIQTANEIVKYLNLQLENYKETYDIFGPTEVTLNNNKTVSFSTQSHQNMIELYRAMEHERSKQERNCIHLEKRQNVESPDIKEFRVFPEKEEGHNQSLVIQSKEVMTRSRKYSLIPERLPTRDRFKTEKKVDRQTQLMGHAETFMKIIKGASHHEVSIIKQLENNQQMKKKTYRRRKLKRLATVEHYF